MQHDEKEAKQTLERRLSFKQFDKKSSKDENDFCRSPEIKIIDVESPVANIKYEVSAASGCSAVKQNREGKRTSRIIHNTAVKVAKPKKGFGGVTGRKSIISNK